MTWLEEIYDVLGHIMWPDSDDDPDDHYYDYWTDEVASAILSYLAGEGWDDELA